MKIAVITDTHFGVRGDASWMLDHQEDFYVNHFFPILRDHGISHILHLGDIVDRRKFINFNTLNRMKNMFLNPIIESNMDMMIIPGNHDVYYKNTNDINALDELISTMPNVHVIREPKVLEFDQVSIGLLPWVNSENEETYTEWLSNNNFDILAGHLEIKGFEMFRGAVSTHGMPKSIFSKFDEVWSGHFHHKSQQDNIKYLGAPYEMTWSDYNDPRGFHIFDTDTRELTFFRNENRLFMKTWYDDENVDFDKLMNFDEFQFENKFVKIILKNKTNAYFFDKYSDKIQSGNPIKIQVVDDHKNIMNISEDDLVNEAEDTMTIINKHVDNMKVKQSRELKNLLKDLYISANNIEQ